MSISRIRLSNNHRPKKKENISNKIIKNNKK